jgi:hypothetical protein
MSFEEALEADRQHEFEAAANAYEQLLANHDPDVFLNLLVLYWEATDFGISSSYRLSAAFVERSNGGFRQMLNHAPQLFPTNTAVEFWRRYIAGLEHQGPWLSSKECKAMLARQPAHLEPAMIVFAESDCTEGVDDARRLLEWCQAQRTTRAGYVSAYLDGVTQRARFRWPP